VNAPIWAMCLFAAMAFAAVPVSNWLGRYPVVRYNDVYVIRPVGDYGYWMRINGNKVYVVFCQDFGNEPQFDTGETIKTLTIRDLGDCWSVKNMHPAFIMLRDDLTGELIRRPDKEIP
jgi:hypothetical protein